MNQKICIVVVDAIDSNAFRHDPPNFYAPKAKKTEEERKAEVKAQLADGGWPRDEEECVDRTDFNRFIKKLNKSDEFRAGYLSIPADIGKPFFWNVETQQMFAKHNPRVLNKDDYLKIIEMMRKMIADRYYDILHDRHNWQGVLESRMEMWESSHEFPYNLEHNTSNIANVYDAEIQIWDLVRMYKTIDWIGDNVIVYNW